jgi:hypothetical protein
MCVPDASTDSPSTDARPTGILDRPNEGRELHASLAGVVYARHPVRTHLVTETDDAAAVVARYASPLDDAVRVVAVSERMVAITQGRSYPISEIRPGRLARLLERFVTRPGYGIGLGSAETMQLAIEEVGAPRILLAAAASAVTKPFGVHGVFYRVAGPQRSGRGTRTARPVASPRASASRWPSSTPTMPAVPFSAPVRGSTAASSSACSPTTRSARPASRRRSASCVRWRGRPVASCRPSPGGG